jgi:hypothetical protein
VSKSLGLAVGQSAQVTSSFAQSVTQPTNRIRFVDAAKEYLDEVQEHKQEGRAPAS